MQNPINWWKGENYVVQIYYIRYKKGKKRVVSNTEAHILPRESILSYKASQIEEEHSVIDKLF